MIWYELQETMEYDLQATMKYYLQAKIKYYLQAQTAKLLGIPVTADTTLHGTMQEDTRATRIAKLLGTLLLPLLVTSTLSRPRGRERTLVHAGVHLQTENQFISQI